MNYGAIVVYLIIGLVAGAFAGWAAASLVNLLTTAHADPSAWTGWGLIPGGVAGLVIGYRRRFA